MRIVPVLMENKIACSPIAVVWAIAATFKFVGVIKQSVTIAITNMSV